MGPIWAFLGKPIMGMPISALNGTGVDILMWVYPEYRTHIITHLGPIWVPYSLLAGKMLVLSSRNMIPQSVIGIDKICLHVYKERTDALDLRGQNSCSMFSVGGSKHI